MTYLIKFGENVKAVVSAMAGTYQGFSVLRMQGTETEVNAIAARLLSNEHREKSYETGVIINKPSGVSTVAAQKGKFKMVRTKLNNVYADAILMHTDFMSDNDTHEGFQILSFEPGIPLGFYQRLDKSLTLAIKPEWESELWEYGKREYKDSNNGGKWYTSVNQPIAEMDSSAFGVFCYEVRTEKQKETWKNIIKNILGVQ